MIIDGPDSVTKAVLSEIERAPDPRFREVMSALVRHLHAFVREVKLTEDEFRQAGEYINAIGRNTNAYHNEAVLMSGSLGVSTARVPAQQRQQRRDRNHREPARAVLAARLAAHRRTAARSSVRRRPGRSCSSTPRSRTRNGKPVADAEVDVWQSSTEGLYENQDPDPGRHEPARQVHDRRAGPISVSAASSRRATRSRSTGRSAISCARRAATTCGRRICTS